MIEEKITSVRMKKKVVKSLKDEYHNIHNEEQSERRPFIE